MRTIVALALLFSAQAFACPTLTGTYTCTYQDGTSEVVTLSQDNKAGVEVYNYNGSIITADNASYSIPDDQTLKEGQFKAWCDDAITLKSNILGKYFQDGSFVGDLDMNIFLSLENGSLKSVTSGTLTNTGGVYPLDDTVTCAPTVPAN